MYLLALRLAEVRGDAARRSGSPSWSTELRALPQRIDELLEQRRRARSRQIADALARRRLLPLPRPPRRACRSALEGALKLKEISYIPTDAYAAGEMKHGPIALLDERTPVVCVATDSPVLDKVLSNIAEVRARGAHVIAVATEGNDDVARARRGGRLRAGAPTGCSSRCWR